MKKIVEKFKSLFQKKKKEPWYKKIIKKSASVMDMKRRNKFITFFILLFVAVYFCMPSLETIVKDVVHKYGSQITGTDVSLGGIDLKLSEGSAAVKGIKIGNPKGYQSKNLFYLKELGVKLDISSLTGDTIIIESITINNPEITYEMKTLKQSNVSEILDNIKKNTASAESQDKSTPKEETKKDTDSAGSKKVIIKTLTVADGKVSAILGSGSVKAPINVALPKIEMKNIGQEKQSGESIPVILSKVITKILQTASQTVVSANLEGLRDATLESVKNVTDNLKDSSDNLKNQGKNAAENVQKAADDIKNSLGGLFKK